MKTLLVAHTHDTILCFSTKGKVYWLKTYQVPLATRGARGRPIVNLLPLEANEQITTILPVKKFDHEYFIFMATKKGFVKKVAIEHFAKPRLSGKLALELEENDELINAAITDGKQEIMLMSNSGKAIRFSERAVRSMGRTARGIRGIKLKVGQQVISLILVKEGATILTATEHGYGQRTSVEDYRTIGRGGMGVIAIQVNVRNGEVVGAVQVVDQDDILLISNLGTMVRIPANEISIIGRNTQGVRLIKLSEGEQLVGLEKVESLE